jgi:tetratricopeptide (TPR) repeat protein
VRDCDGKTARTDCFDVVAVSPALSQTASTDGDKLALPVHKGLLRWRADGFKVAESSAKSGGREIGIRAKDAAGRLQFLGFLFLFPEQAPLDSAKCRDGVINPEKKSNPTLKVLSTSEISQPKGPSVALTRYTYQKRDGKTRYAVRGFAAAGDVCGDLAFFSDTPISVEDADLKTVFANYLLDSDYVPQFNDSLLYAQILYQHGMYKAAAPIFEQALTKLNGDDPETKTMRRVTTDQAGMAYGMSGDIAKSRSLFEAAISKDPDYPLYYYNLACADAEEKKPLDARSHLEQAFARKANTISGEAMPDPTKDDSFLPYRTDKDFWKFLESLR